MYCSLIHVVISTVISPEWNIIRNSSKPSDLTQIWITSGISQENFRGWFVLVIKPANINEFFLYILLDNQMQKRRCPRRSSGPCTFGENPLRIGWTYIFAQPEGFEPSVRISPCRINSPVPSSTRPKLQNLWAMLGSNQRPLACKASALNQLS